MKKTTLVLVLFWAAFTFAQQDINYKALINDDNGNVVASTAITVAFTIYQGAGETTIAYEETHNPTTDANGIIILNIGEGTTSDVFTDIDWAVDEHFLNTQIDTGSGLTDMGTTQFMAVPYAMLAEKVSQEYDPKVGSLTNNVVSKWNGTTLIDGTINDVSGKIGIGTTTPGTVITASKLDVVGGHIAISNNYGVFSYNSTGNGIGAGFDTTPTDDLLLYAGGSKLITVNKNGSVAIGSGSTASGISSTAIGTATTTLEHSTAIGYLALSQGKHSVAIGRNVTAVRDGALAMGVLTEANGTYSTALGFRTKAGSFNSTAIGRYNVGNGGWGSWFNNEPIFEIGIGFNESNRKNAMTVLKNGSVGIGTHFPAFPLHVTIRNTGVGDSNPNYYLANSGVGINGTGWTYSIGATYGIWSGVGFAVSSDSRIKKIIGISNQKEDLTKLMHIEITDYQYIDTVNKGNLVTKKVIAQQVKEVLPNAVHLTAEFIPNIYEMATVETIDKNTIILNLTATDDLEVGNILKLVPKEQTEQQAIITAIEKNKVTVKLSSSIAIESKIFVFGKQVKDFHTVDYDAISMLNISATQAQQKLIEDLQKEVANLKELNKDLQVEVSNISILKKEMAEIKKILFTNLKTNTLTQN